MAFQFFSSGAKKAKEKKVPGVLLFIGILVLPFALIINFFAVLIIGKSMFEMPPELKKDD